MRTLPTLALVWVTFYLAYGPVAAVWAAVAAAVPVAVAWVVADEVAARGQADTLNDVRERSKRRHPSNVSSEDGSAPLVLVLAFLVAAVIVFHAAWAAMAGEPAGVLVSIAGGVVIGFVGLALSEAMG